MRTVALLVGALALCLGGIAQAKGSHVVKGYVKKNGTYVAPHRVSNPNKSKMDIWSSKGNVNPYTGKAGTKDPYAPIAPRRDR